MATTATSHAEDDHPPWQAPSVTAEAACVQPSTPLPVVAQQLAEATPKVVVIAVPGNGPLGDGWQPLGVITEAEVVRACAQGQDLRGLVAEAVMVEAAMVTLGDTLPTADELRTRQSHPYLLVLDDNGQLLGVQILADAIPSAVRPLFSHLEMSPWQALQAQRNYSHLIAAIISRFVEIRPADLDREIRHTLSLVLEATQVDACYLSFYGQSEPAAKRWTAGFSEAAAIVPSDTQLSWSYGLLRQDKIVCVPHIANLPREAAADQALWQQHGIEAVLSLPLVHKAAVVGAIGLVARCPIAWWQAETIQLLQVLGHMIVATQQRLEDEQQLQESEARLRLALQAANQGLYDLNLQTGEVIVSPEYATMLGYDPKTFEETEDRWIEMLHPEDREVFNAAYEGYIAGDLSEYRLRFRLKTQPGEWKWVLSLGKVVAWDEAGQPLRMLGTHTDIDDFKRAETALQTSEIRFRTFMDNSPMAAWITDPETNRLEYASQGWYRNYALPPDLATTSLKGQSLFDLFPEAIACIYASHNRWVAERNELLEVVEPGLRPDQTPGEYLTFKFPLPQPYGKTLVGGVAIDITERNRTEQRLALQSAILARIAHSEPLPEILTALVLALENHLPGSLCSILFCGGDNRLYPGVAPHLPAAYTEALRGTSVGEAMGSCGTAAVRRRPVIVEDIATDPLWADFRDLALANGLRACWSIPIFGSDGPVLATLAVYYPTPQRPYPYELDTLQLVANLAKVAIEKDQATTAIEQLNRELEHRVAQRTEALRASEARLKEAQQVARLGHWEMDVHTRQITWSNEVMTLLGYAQGEGPGDLRPHLSDEAWQQFQQLIDQALTTAEPCTAHLPIVRLDGSQGYLFIKATSHGPDDGSIRRLFGIAMDVSDQKAMQDALQRSEAQTRATLLALPDLIFRVNREGRYLDFMASPSAGNLVDPRSAVGKHLSEALPPYTSQEHLAQKLVAIHRALETQTVQCYEHVVAFHGDQRYEEVRVAPCGQDEVVFFIRDISDRKRTELELRRSRDLREAIFNESTDALFLVDAETNLTLDCNQRAVELFGATDKHQLINIQGHTLQVQPFTPDELQMLYEEISYHGVWSRELEYRTLTGETFWGHIAAKLITLAGQRIKLVQVTDITDRKRAEAALQHTNQELARATRMKDEFLANMSHELRTPLNAILGMAEGLQDEAFGPLNPRQRHALRTIGHSGGHLLELINDILDLAKIEAGQMSLDCAPVAVTYLCSSSLPFVQPQAQAKTITLRTEVPNDLPDLLIDERRLRQVLINLLNNAVKFTPTGGTVTLSVTRLDPKAGSPWLRITVSDTGIGIAPEDVEKLFKPFVQIDSTLNRQYSGTGLGLALVQRIVHLHGGEVKVQSALGTGSHFSIDLPGLQAPPRFRLKPNLGHLSAQAGAVDEVPLILLVEEDEARSSTISSYLGAKGYRIAVATTEQAAMEMAQKLRPALVLLDFQMNDIDGLGITRAIRDHPELGHTLIVALTTLATPADRDQCLALGLDDCIRKPIKLKTLATTVQTLLNHQA